MNRNELIELRRRALNAAPARKYPDAGEITDEIERELERAGYKLVRE